MTEDESVSMFDWGLYGMLVRKKRIDLGYKKAEEFAASIWRRTRIHVSRDSLYKIEQGRQIPDGNQFMGINMALCGNPFYPEITGMCMSNEWKKIAPVAEGHGELSIPDKWKTENIQAILDENEDVLPNDCSIYDLKFMGYVNDQMWLFGSGEEIPF